MVRTIVDAPTRLCELCRRPLGIDLDDDYVPLEADYEAPPPLDATQPRPAIQLDTGQPAPPPEREAANYSTKRATPATPMEPMFVADSVWQLDPTLAAANGDQGGVPLANVQPPPPPLPPLPRQPRSRQQAPPPMQEAGQAVAPAGDWELLPADPQEQQLPEATPSLEFGAAVPAKPAVVVVVAPPPPQTSSNPISNLSAAAKIGFAVGIAFVGVALCELGRLLTNCLRACRGRADWEVTPQ